MQGHAIDPKSPLPRYYQIYSAILSMIEAHEFEMGDALPAERQLAEHFGVARPTVVKALDLLTRKGYLDKQQGRGNIVIAPKKPKNKPKALAFVAAPPITYDIITGISQKAFEYGYHLQILGVDYDYPSLESYLNACVSSGVQGFLIYGRCDTGDLKLYKQLIDRGVAVVMLDRYHPELSCDHVVYDNEAASYKLTQALLASGHQTIAVLPGQEINTTAVKDRLEGHRRALKDAGISYNEELVWLDLYNNDWARGDVLAKPQERGYEIPLQEALNTYKPTAIFTINDSIASELMHDLFTLNHRRLANSGQAGNTYDLELATFSASAKTDYLYLTTLAVHPAAQLGRVAAELLISRINGTVIGAPQHKVIPMDIANLSNQDWQYMSGKEIAQTTGR